MVWEFKVSAYWNGSSWVIRRDTVEGPVWITEEARSDAGSTEIPESQLQALVELGKKHPIRREDDIEPREEIVPEPSMKNEAVMKDARRALARKWKWASCHVCGKPMSLVGVRVRHEDEKHDNAFMQCDECLNTPVAYSIQLVEEVRKLATPGARIDA